MDANIVTAIAALMGSLVGGLASFGTTWFTHRSESRRDHISRQLLRREALYSEFIYEAARLYSEALVNGMEKPECMAKIWGLVSRIRLSSSDPVLAAAEHMLRSITDQFLAEPLTLHQIREVTMKTDPLKEFGDACRAEMEEIDTDA